MATRDDMRENWPVVAIGLSWGVVHGIEARGRHGARWWSCVEMGVLWYRSVLCMRFDRYVVRLDKEKAPITGAPCWRRQVISKPLAASLLLP